MFELIDLEITLYGAAAVLDTAVLLVLWERHNRRRIVLPLYLFALGVWIYHAGAFGHAMLRLASEDWALPLRWGVMEMMVLGLIIQPCAIVHGLSRLASDGFEPAPVVRRWRVALYLPLLFAVPTGSMLATDPAQPLLTLLRPLVLPYVTSLVAINLVSGVALLRLRARTADVAERGFLKWLGISLLTVALIQGVVFGTVVDLERWHEGAPDLWRGLVVAATVALILPVMALTYAIVRYNFLQLVLRRSVVYGAVLVALVLVHRMLLTELWESLGQRYQLDFVLLEGVALLTIVLLLKPLRERLAEGLEYLLGERVAAKRERLVQLAAQMSAMFTEAPERILHWFTQAIAESYGFGWVVVSIVDDGAQTSWNAGHTDRIGLPDLDALRDACITTGLRHFGPGDAPNLRLSALLIRIRASHVLSLSHQQMHGVVIVGPRRRGFGITGEQLSGLVMLIDQLGFTLRNATLRAQRSLAERRALQNEKLSTLGLVAGSIAHEVKNPLSAIKTITTVLAEELGEQSPHAQDLAVILAETERLNGTVSDILAFARPSRQAQEIVSVPEALESTLAVMRRLARQRDVQLDCTIGSSELFVEGDANGLREICFNLLANALEAAAKDKRVAVAVRGVGDEVELKVHNWGDPIVPEVLERIFEPFITTREGGTGLGLYVVSQRVQDMKGRVRCTSSADHGTEFTVTFPQARRRPA